MRFLQHIALIVALLPLAVRAGDAVPVTADNFARAETDRYFSNVIKLAGGLGRFQHRRTLEPIDKQLVVRANRDTLYSAAVFDLDAGPVTITLPEAGKRFRSLIVIDEDHYVPAVVYAAGRYTYTREQIGTRYLMLALRTFVDPADPADFRRVHTLQDATKLEQPAGVGRFEVPTWDAASHKKVRDALLTLASTLPDSARGFGARGQVDPVRRLILTASAWGGNPDREATYLNVFPEHNDGKAAYRLVVKDKVPVDGFWSITVYDGEGRFIPNPFDAYTLNNVTAAKQADGTVAVQFGDCNARTPNCLPTGPGWNYMVRMFRPHAEILDGSWRFPQATQIQ